MNRRRRIGKAALVLLGALAFWQGSAQAAVQNASMAFCNTSCIFATGTTGVAGDGPGFFVKFTVPNGFNGATHSITIDATNLAPGTRFPSSRFDYIIHFDQGAYTVLGSASLSNNAQRVVLTPANDLLNVPAGGQMAIAIGGPTKPGAALNPTVAMEGYRFLVSTTNDSAAATTTFTIVPDEPAAMAWYRGAEQATQVGTPFPSIVSVRLMDQFGNPIAGEQITFSGPDSEPRGIISPAGGTTSSAGITSTAVTAGQVAGSWELTASGPNDVTAKTTMVNLAGPPDQVTVELDPPTLVADGASRSTAEATVTDAFGNPLAGREVAAEIDGDQHIGPVTDLGDGRYSAEITASTTPGDATITFTDMESGLNGQATLTIDPDLEAPRVKLLKKPKRVVRAARVELRFASDASDLAGFECKLDKRPFKPCASPKRYRVKRGRHAVSVRAVDFVGNKGKPKTVRFRRSKR